MSNQQIENFEKAFYNDGFQLGMKAGGTDADRNSMFSAIRQMYAAIDAVIESLNTMAIQQGQAIECKLGCEWCCHQPVFVLDYELDYLENYIDEYFDKETLREIRSKARNKAEKLRKLAEDELLNSKYACPFLNNGACIAYEARPMACRIYLSSSVKTCLLFFKTPDDKNNYPALLDFPMRLGRMMNEGFKTALKMNGIKPEESRIEERFMNLKYE